MKLQSWAAAAFCVAALSACSSGLNAVIDTARSVFRGGDGPSVDSVPLNPNFRYLRVTLNGRVALLARGYRDQHPLGEVEVWYSAEKEVLRLQNGRLVGATGVTTEWRAVTLPKLPSWSAVAVAKSPVQWVRTRDVMPGYRYGVRDAVRLYAIPPPAKTQLKELGPGALTWFEEQVESDSREQLPARYGVELRDGIETVIYGEQCLASELCFTWQRWPAPANLPGRK